MRVTCGDGDDVFDVTTSDDGVVMLLLAAVWFNSLSSGYKETHESLTSDCVLHQGRNTLYNHVVFVGLYVHS